MHELFAGTADCYRRFRPPYPVEAFDWIIAQHGLNGTGRLLDCGCGAGGVFLGLARWFSHTIAIDPDDAMLAAARLTAMENRIEAITFLHSRVEDVPDSTAPLRMATFGASFHWTDRIMVAQRLDKLIETNGAIVILSPSSLWTGRARDWKEVVIDTIKCWLGEERRAGSGTYRARPQHQECLIETPFCALTEIAARLDHGRHHRLSVLDIVRFEGCSRRQGRGIRTRPPCPAVAPLAGGAFRGRDRALGHFSEAPMNSTLPPETELQVLAGSRWLGRRSGQPSSHGLNL